MAIDEVVNLASRLTIAGCLVVLSASGCSSMKAASTGAKPNAAQAAAPPDDSRSPPVESPPAASAPVGPRGTADTEPPVAAPPVKPETTSNPTKSNATAGTRPAKQPVAAPLPVPAPATKPASELAAATLDLRELEARLRDTHAIGVFTKLSLKNQVDDLLDEFRTFYRASNRNPSAELRRHYDVLLGKVLGLLRDGDPTLAAAVSSSREAIWGILADPDKFAKL